MSAAAKPLEGGLAASGGEAPGEPAASRPGRGAGLPRHVGIIMDGNGRWATARSLPRALGHKAGAEAVRRTIEAAVQCDIGWLTLFAFSSENWQRPADEVRDLTSLMRMYLRSEVGTLAREGI
ncbi:MAG: hypothetical protein B7Z53_01195, partial [Rhodospirillales bacterium 12-71-4]